MKTFLKSLWAFIAPGVTNYSGVGTTNGLSGSPGQTFQNDIDLHIADEVLRLSYRNLVAYQFGQELRIPPNQGATYTATRFERLPLPYAPLQEGVASAGQALTIAQVSATAQQWGDLVRITDVADLTIKHPLFKQATRLIAMQQSETVERNTINILLTGTQVNFANSKANRASLLATDVMSPVEISKIVGNLRTFGAPEYMGNEREQIKGDMDARRDVQKDPGGKPHYVALVHPLVEQDLVQNSSISNAFAYSGVNALYNGEVGEWGGARFCRSNMIPYWTGVAQINGTGSGTGGNFAAGTYYIQVTAAPAATSVEQKIYQVSTSITLTGTTSSISVTLPNLPGYVFNVYVGTTTSPTNLALSASGPSTGSLAGQATQLAGNQTVVLTNVGTAQTPPAAPATGVTVYPTFFFGTDAYGQVMLENLEYHYLKDADKSDPQNQTRVVSWKMMYGTIILNNAYMARVESGSAYSVGYTAGTATE